MEIYCIKLSLIWWMIWTHCSIKVGGYMRVHDGDQPAWLPNEAGHSPKFSSHATISYPLASPPIYTSSFFKLLHPCLLQKSFTERRGLYLKDQVSMWGVDSHTRKKERTVALVISAVLAGFRAIDTGTSYDMITKSESHTYLLARQPKHYRYAW